MKRILIIAVILFSSYVIAQKNKEQNKQINREVLDAERPSELIRIKGVIGKDNKVTVQWGSPSVKGREIWGMIVPYNEVWRSGANEATTIEFEKDVLINDMPLKAGKYGLFMIPTNGAWTIIFNSVWNQWGAFEYDSEKDALRIQVKPENSTHVENLEYRIEAYGISFYWEKIRIQFDVSAK